ncbi:hypothetical protein CAK95_13715 [Pseudorhodoplanes sinuspersici]|uniref:OpgC protein n=1 Tax=Pseudorhodoplanes sinuspersici TaxID=1235591 RepID=A0A1W6ZRK2_9HYPH|nr:hypothetical protein CAK95_13715 [Pseudorhodoplanes sinuspersici]
MQQATEKSGDGPTALRQRDLRLDFFRGLALWLIFVDHIPGNIVGRVTVRNYGFSDAAEIFIFISGYSAAIAYARAMSGQGFLIASARILKRVWQLYVAFVLLLAAFFAQIAYVARTFENPLFAEEMNIVDLLKQPDVTLPRALTLQFNPANMDILPVYIVLLLTFPFALWLLLRAPVLALGLSLALYIAAGHFEWHFHRLSARLLGDQPAALAVAVRLRRMVRAGRGAKAVSRPEIADHDCAGDRLSCLRVPDRALVVLPDAQ